MAIMVTVVSPVVMRKVMASDVTMSEAMVPGAVALKGMVSVGT